MIRLNKIGKSLSESLLENLEYEKHKSEKHKKRNDINLLTAPNFEKNEKIKERKKEEKERDEKERDEKERDEKERDEKERDEKEREEKKLRTLKKEEPKRERKEMKEKREEPKKKKEKKKDDDQPIIDNTLKVPGIKVDIVKTKKQYSKEEIAEKLKGYIKVPSADYNKIDIGEFIRFNKGDDFYIGGQIVHFGFHKEKNTAFWIYTPSLIPIDGKFMSRYTVYWKDISQLWKRFGRPYEIEILYKKIVELQEKINAMTKFLRSKFGSESF
jgi:hypothetical protein